MSYTSKINIFYIKCYFEVNKKYLKPERFLKVCVKCLHLKHAVADCDSVQPIHCSWQFSAVCTSPKAICASSTSVLGIFYNTKDIHICKKIKQKPNFFFEF